MGPKQSKDHKIVNRILKIIYKQKRYKICNEKEKIFITLKLKINNFFKQKNLSKELMEKIMTVFNKMDVDGSGTIDKVETKKYW